MNISKRFLEIGEPAAAGFFEEPERGLFYRKALSLRRYYETCPLAEYHGEALYPSGILPSSGLVLPNYLSGLSVNFSELRKKDVSLAELFERDFGENRSFVPPEHTVAGNMYTHSMPNYERFLKEGILSYIPRIEKIEDSDLRDGLLHLISGIKTYILRCVEKLENSGAPEKLTSALKKVPLFPAENIYEAVLSWNFIMYLDGCDNLGCVASGLMPYFNGENIGELLGNLFDNLDQNNGYSMALGTDYNPLTLQCLNALNGKRRPMTELFVNDTTPDEIWEAALKIVKSGGGQPAFYNPDVLLSGLRKKFDISEEDIKKFCGGGCTESMIAGLSNVGSLDAGINLLLIFEEIMYAQLENCPDFTDFYNAYISAVRKTVLAVTDAVSRSRLARKETNPLPMRTLLIDDCIDKGLEYNSGGARYSWSIINFAGIINVIDSMLVIKEMVFDKKSISPKELLCLLRKNDEEFLQTARRQKLCFGVDNNTANAFSKQLTSDIFAMLDGCKLPFGKGFIAASIQFMWQTAAGSGIGATPDGRCSGAPLADSLAAVFEKDKNGYTALLNSVTSLDLEHALGVPVLNLNIEPDFDDNILKSLILGYMKSGGIQLQITCASRETLIAAYENPDSYKNLIVRVGGYSEYFCRLNDDLKKMIIARSIQKSPQI